MHTFIKHKPYWWREEFNLQESVQTKTEKQTNLIINN